MKFFEKVQKLQASVFSRPVVDDRFNDANNRRTTGNHVSLKDVDTAIRAAWREVDFEYRQMCFLRIDFGDPPGTRLDVNVTVRRECADRFDEIVDYLGTTE